MSVLRVATRRSPQARTQAQAVADTIAAATGRVVELVFVDTAGDQRRDVPLHTIGGVGVFTKEVQAAVLDGRADIATHSAKDLPTTPVDGLTIGAFCARRDPADVLVGRALAELSEGATVASGSVRRRAQLAALRPDLRFVELRGNIARRLEQVPDGGALMMAAAALEILAMTELIADRLDPSTFIPAVGQGCVVAECRVGDDEVLAALSSADDRAARLAVEVERAFLAALGTGCSLPIGAHVAGGGLHAFVAAGDPLAGGHIAGGPADDGPGAGGARASGAGAGGDLSTVDTDVAGRCASSSADRPVTPLIARDSLVLAGDHAVDLAAAAALARRLHASVCS